MVIDSSHKKRIESNSVCSFAIYENCVRIHYGIKLFDGEFIKILAQIMFSLYYYIR